MSLFAIRHGGRARWGVLAAVVAVLGSAPGCSTGGGAATGGAAVAAPSPTSSAASAASATSATSVTSVTSAASVTSTSGCVRDVARVISTAPSAARSSPLPTDLANRLDAAAHTAFGQASAPGAVVGVRSPAGTWTKAYGLADPVAGTAMTVGVHTRIGSITKTFTGTAIMQLAEQGRLSLDDPIASYVPHVPNGAHITLRQLASMTSGIPSYTQNTAFTDVFLSKPETVFTPQQLLDVAFKQPALFAPGTAFDYSNTNTILLGLVIEKMTGQPASQAITQQVLEPLKLSHTTWPGESTALPEPYAQGFTLLGKAATPDAPSNATHWNPAWAWTAGELVSTIDDLLVYGRALGTGQGLLDATSQTERLTSFPGTAGYGIGMGCSGGWVGHTGELPGYNTALFYDTRSDTTVAVQVNSDIASGGCTESPVLTDDARDLPCSSPATRIFVALSAQLGNPFTPQPKT